MPFIALACRTFFALSSLCAAPMTHPVQAAVADRRPAPTTCPVECRQTIWTIAATPDARSRAAGAVDLELTMSLLDDAIVLDELTGFGCVSGPFDSGRGNTTWH